MKTLKLFWWAPARSPHLAWPELKSNPGVWLRLGARTGRMATNFGDELSKHVVEAVTGRRVAWASPGSADVVAVGSVLGLYASLGSGAAIWGSGIREALNTAEAEHLKSRLGPILAVRGHHTRDALGLGESQILGDPGVLSPLFAKRTRAVNKRPLIIPHFRAWGTRPGRQLLQDLHKAGHEIAEPTIDPRSMVNRISNSSFVLTSSLHGLILGHSLGVPTQLVTWSGQAGGEPDFKYEDYFSSVGEQLSRHPITIGLDKSALSAVQERCESRVTYLLDRTADLANQLTKAAEQI